MTRRPASGPAAVARQPGRARPSSRDRCIEPGHWVIGGRHVRAVYFGRSRNIQSWNVDPMTGDSSEPPVSGFLYLADARDWIRGQDEQRDTRSGDSNAAN